MQDRNRRSRVSHDRQSPGRKSRRYIGRYEIIYPIAHGGMASVYACRLTGLAGFQRLLAIKIIHPHLSSEREFIEMFLDEARLSAWIHHPNVGEVIEVGEDKGTYYMVCELILGQSLGALHRSAQKTDVTIAPEMYARIVSIVAGAVHAAHELKSPAGAPLNIVHRDISPRNILLTYNGFVKLIDFGVAYAQGKISQTDVGTLKGKVRYMSPEQVRCQPLDRRSDIFSLGVVLYEMVTGRTPFVGETDIERLKKILDYNLEWPGSFIPDIPVQLENIIKRAMAYLPEERYLSAAAMSADLEAFVSKSSENVDSDHLSSLMHSLFADEYASHLERIQAIEAHQDELPEDDSMTTELGATGSENEMTEQMPLRPRLGSDAGGYPETTLYQMGWRWKQLPSTVKTLTIGLLSIGMFVLVFLLIFGLPGTSEQTAEGGDHPVQPSAADEPDAPAVSPVASDAGGINSSSEVKKSSVRIALELQPADADVKLDGVSVVPTNNSIQMDRDDRVHRLQFFADGYLPREELIPADVDMRLVISLTPAPAAEVTKNGRHSSGNKTTTHGTIRDTGPMRTGTLDNRGRASASSQNPNSGGSSELLEKSPYQ